LDYLYKALTREIGVVESELASFSRVKPHRVERVAGGRAMESVAPARARLGKAVPFPVALAR